MARTIKTGLSNTKKKEAVLRTFQLHKNGVSLTDSRITIANELNMTPGTLARWQKEFKMHTPIKVTKTTNSVTRSSGRVTIGGISDIKSELGSVFQSLVAKDGRYTPKEASAISQVSTNILGLSKFELEVHKYADKMRKRDVTVKNLLT